MHLVQYHRAPANGLLMAQRETRERRGCQCTLGVRRSFLFVRSTVLCSISDSRHPEFRMAIAISALVLKNSALRRADLSCIKPSCCRTQMRNAYEVAAEVL